MFEGLGGEWGDSSEAAELQRQMATLEEKITHFKQEIVDDYDEQFVHNNPESKLLRK